MKFSELETPCYIVDSEQYEKNIEELMHAYEAEWKGNILYGYSVKTNHFPYMLKAAMKYGWKAEVVSADEYAFAVACGCEEKNIIYNGPQKKDTVLSACKNGAMVNLDNLKEVKLVCDSLNEAEKQKVCVGIRINYDLEKECPGETTCKNMVGRFGISYENGDVKKAIQMLKEAGIPLKGIHMHQSSSSRSLRIYESLAKKAVAIVKEFGMDDLEYIDMGGGYFGGNFFSGKPTVEQYAKTICGILSELVNRNITLVLEPGAAVLATSMEYLVSVLNIRDIRGQRVVTVDGTVVDINPFMNPHPTPFTMLNPGAKTQMEQIIGGSSCMELDRFYPRDIENMVEEDSKLLFYCCGAYMSTHNSSFINVPPNIYLKEKEEYTILRKKNQQWMLEC